MNQQMLANPGNALKPLPRSPKAPLSGALLGEFGTLRSILSLVVLSTLLLPGIVSAQSAERPNSDELLPETTVAYVQIQNVRELFEKMGETNMGKMMEDENIAPLVGDLLQTAQDAYAEVEDRVGLSLEEIQSLPAGEICFAVIAPKRKPAAFVLIVDTDEESEAVDKALERGRDLAEESIKRIVEHTAAAAGAKAVTEYQRNYPPTVNAAGPTSFAGRVAAQLVGEEKVDTDARAVMGGEDFSFMLNARPGAFIFMGNGDSANLHHPEYDFNDDAIPFGCSYWADIVETAMPI